MALTDFKPITTAFAGGANIGADQLEALRSNDMLFERLLRGLLASPFVPTGFDGAVTTPQADQVLFARTIELSDKITLKDGLPLIWFAQESILINVGAEISGVGKGATGNGDLGGSGGGGNTALAVGNDCKVPVTGVPIKAGGLQGAIGTALSAVEQAKWVNRLFAMLGICQGGASGGGADGGKGGGLVFLCAPNIAISGKIDVSGGNGSANSGGGGGGAIILRSVTPAQILNEPANLVFKGGNGGGAGTGKGGDGFVFKSVIAV